MVQEYSEATILLGSDFQRVFPCSFYSCSRNRRYHTCKLSMAQMDKFGVPLRSLYILGKIDWSFHQAWLIYKYSFIKTVLLKGTIEKPLQNCLHVVDLSLPWKLLVQLLKKEMKLLLNIASPAFSQGHVKYLRSRLLFFPHVMKRVIGSNSLLFITS